MWKLIGIWIGIAMMACTGEVRRPSCQEIRETTYKLDIGALSANDKETARKAYSILANGLSTKFAEVSSCEGWFPCITIKYAEWKDDRLGASSGPEIWLSHAALEKRLEGTYTIMHELSHSVRDDSLMRDGLSHSNDETNFMYYRFSDLRLKQLGDGVGLRDDEVKFVCAD